jgi:hypothetical protein
MNLILGNLTGLKAAIMPPALAEGDEWDVTLAGIGRGAAAAIQRLCNRLFERIEDDTFERSADASFIALPRFPVESVSEVALKSDEASGFIPQPDGTILTINKSSGIVELGYTLGSWKDRVRLTYTGGFWADYTEDNSGSQPPGSTAVPPDLRHAWQLQVQHEIEATNLFKGGAAAVATEPTKPPVEFKLLRRVQEILKPYVRYS